MAETYLIKRGKRAVSRRARAHLARYDQFGRIVGAWCHRGEFSFNSNAPWGLKVCKDCARLYVAARATSEGAEQ